MASDADDEWRFSLEEVGDEENDESSDERGTVAGSLDRDQPLEPGSIDPENAAFVLLGAAIVVGLFVAVFLGI